MIDKNLNLPEAIILCGGKGERLHPITLDIPKSLVKLNDIPNTCISTINAIKDLKINYLTVHISSGLEALKAIKKVSRKIRFLYITY